MLTWSCLSASIPLCQCRLIIVFLFVYFCFKQFIESYLSSYQQFSSSIDSFSLYTMAINQNRDIIACARGRKSVDTYPTSKNRKKILKWNTWMNEVEKPLSTQKTSLLPWSYQVSCWKQRKISKAGATAEIESHERLMKKWLNTSRYQSIPGTLQGYDKCIKFYSRKLFNIS